MFCNKDGTVSINQCLNEIHRRAKELGNYDFNCTPQRFMELAGELGPWQSTDSQGARESIVVLQGEIEGHWTNSRRLNYGNGIKGPDFGVDGIGEYLDVTHVELKGPISQFIKRASNPAHPPITVKNDSKDMMSNSKNLVKFWTSANKNEIEKRIDPLALIPKSSTNILCTFDFADVSIKEMEYYKGNITQFSGQSDMPLRQPLFLKKV